MDKDFDGLPLTYESVAFVLFGDIPPDWLAFYFQRWSYTLAGERRLGNRRPTRSGVKNNLKTIQNAANALNAALGCLATFQFLETGEFGRIAYFFQLREQLHDLMRRARAAEKSAALSSEGGVTKPGRGKAILPGAIPPHTLCASMIAEAWKVLHGRYPAPRNRKAALAADMFWRISTIRAVSDGPTDEKPVWGNDRLNRWRPHFKKASALREAGNQGLRGYVHRMTETALAEGFGPPGFTSSQNLDSSPPSCSHRKSPALDSAIDAMVAPSGSISLSDGD
jgi:hypothetical protein